MRILGELVISDPHPLVFGSSCVDLSPLGPENDNSKKLHNIFADIGKRLFDKWSFECAYLAFVSSSD